MKPILILTLAGLAACLLENDSRAQAPVALGGRTMQITVTSGVAPFPSSGVFDFLSSASDNFYARVPLSGLNANATSGTVAYTKTGANTGQLALTDTSLGRLTVNCTFATTNSGTYIVTSPVLPNASFSGPFTLFSGPSPASLAGLSVTITVTSAGGVFQTNGVGRFQAAASGNTYSYTSLSGGPSSSGTYVYTQSSSMTALLVVNDSSGGSGLTQELSFDSPTTGTALLRRAGTQGYQTSTFVMANQGTGPSTPTFTVTPTSVSNTYNGTITLQVAGLTTGETVLVQKYADLNGNGVVAGTDWLVQQFSLTDGQAGMVIGGVTNLNVPGDLDPTSGQITARLNFHTGDFVQTIVGRYLFKLSSPSGRFPPITNAFTVISHPFTQKVTGTVVCNGAAVPNAAVILFGPPTPNHPGPHNPLFGAVADNAGRFTVLAPAGSYLPLAFRPGYMVNFAAGSVATVGQAAAATANVTLVSGTGSIAGKVADSNSSSLGLPGVLVTAASAAGDMTMGFTDADGNFNLGVSAGQCGLMADDLSLVVHGYLGRMNRTAATAGATGITLPVPKANALYYGAVKDNQGNPLPAIDVYTRDDNQQYQTDGYTDADGNYFAPLLGGLSNDPWQVFIPTSGNPTNYAFSGGQDLPMVSGQAVRVDFDALLTGGRQISGTVRANGTNLVNVAVIAWTTMNGVTFTESQVTDATGHYSLTVGNGTWSVFVNTNGRSDSLDTLFGPGHYQPPDSQTVEINNNDATVDFTVVPTPVAGLPTITAQPQSVTVTNGGSATFRVTATGTAPLGYQWQFNGNNLPGATNATLSLSKVSASQAGSYAVVVSNTAGSATSQPAVLTVSTTQPNPLDHWTLRSSPTGQNLQGVAYGNGLFVSVGRNGAIVTSPDGAAWTVRPSGTSLELSDVAFGNGQFAAVGANGTILTSPDGQNWTSRISGTAISLRGIAYGNNRFVATGRGQGSTNGDDWAVLTSPDGVTWTGRASGGPILDMLSGVAYGDHLFVALGLVRILTPDGALVGLYPTIVTSPDGVTWTTHDPGTTNRLSAVAYGSNQFVAIGDSGTILTSPDGVNWVSQGSGSGNQLFAVASGNNLFVAGGKSGTLLTSADGVAWTLRSSGTGLPIQSISYGNGSFVGVGDLGLILQSDPFAILAPTLMTQPQSQTVVAGANAALTVTAAGTPPLSYQWQFNGNNLIGATDSSLTLTNVTANQAGSYVVVIGNSAGTAISQPAVVTVLPATANWQLPRDFNNPVWLREDFPDTRPPNLNPTRPAQPTPLNYGGPASIMNGSLWNNGPEYVAPGGYPYVMLDTNRQWVLLHPAVGRASSVGFVAPAAGHYQISGAFARANNAQNAGDGVAVAIARNLDTTNLVFAANIPASAPVNVTNLFGSPAGVPFNLTLDLTRGDTLRFLVFCGPPGDSNMNFDVTGLQFAITTSTPAPGAPKLRIVASGSNITLSWGDAAGFQLESAATLGLGAVWTAVAGITGNSINLPKTANSQFFRLRK